MKYRIQIQQVFGGNWSNMEEASQHAEWLQCDNIKPRNRIEALAALVAKANQWKNGAPHRLVAIQPDGEFRVIETTTRGTAFFPASVGSVVGAITRANSVEPKRKELTADSAWFLVRTMGPVTGMNAFQIERFLRSATIGRIEDDAEGIQEDFYSRVADKAQELLVGRIEP